MIKVLKVMPALWLYLYLSTLLTGCSFITQDLQTLREGQQQQQQQLEQQSRLLEEQSRQLARLAQDQQKMQSHLQQLPELWSNATPEVKSLKSPVATPTPKRPVLTREGKLVLGRVEWTWLNGQDLPFKARVDTGAGTSSLNARQLLEFERDGKQWVRFVLHVDDKGVERSIEAPVVRYTRIRQSSNDQLERRPVIRLKLRLGQLTEEAEFTLSDRSNMIYPVLLGREFLQDIAIVDVARKFVQPKPRGQNNRNKAQNTLKARP